MRGAGVPAPGSVARVATSAGEASKVSSKVGATSSASAAGVPSSGLSSVAACGRSRQAANGSFSDADRANRRLGRPAASGKPEGQLRVGKRPSTSRPTTDIRPRRRLREAIIPSKAPDSRRLLRSSIDRYVTGRPTTWAFGTAGAQAVIVTLRTTPINSIAAITFPQRQVVNQ